MLEQPPEGLLLSDAIFTASDACIIVVHTYTHTEREREREHFLL